MTASPAKRFRGSCADGEGTVVRATLPILRNSAHIKILSGMEFSNSAQEHRSPWLNELRHRQGEYFPVIRFLLRFMSVSLLGGIGGSYFTGLLALIRLGEEATYSIPVERIDNDCVTI
ncbi:hypothetical protein M434DRAFT_27642 [Hypoxylon sp. CO27-5]|nr:hypothetical protein M434DRAFT_27642 [Hypoxylon sp. CO27-5]